MKRILSLSYSNNMVLDESSIYHTTNMSHILHYFEQSNKVFQQNLGSNCYNFYLKLQIVGKNKYFGFRSYFLLYLPINRKKKLDKFFKK